MKNTTHIQTERLLIRDIESSDINNIYKGLSHPDVIKHYGINFNSLEATKEQMEWFASPEQKWFAICSLNNEDFFGAAGLNGISMKDRKAEIGLWLLPEYWGKGIMKEVLPIICDYGFDKLDLHRIEGFVESENISCKKVMSKLDFEHEGTMIDCEVKNNKFISVDIYAKINRSM